MVSDKEDRVVYGSGWHWRNGEVGSRNVETPMKADADRILELEVDNELMRNEMRNISHELRDVRNEVASHSDILFDYGTVKKKLDAILLTLDGLVRP